MEYNVFLTYLFLIMTQGAILLISVVAKVIPGDSAQSLVL